LGEGLALEGQLPGGYEDDPLNAFDFLIYLVQKGDQKGPSFPCAVFSPSDDAFPSHDERDGFLLDGGGDQISTFGERQDDVLSQIQLVEIFVLCCLYVLS